VAVVADVRWLSLRRRAHAKPDRPAKGIQTLVAPDADRRKEPSPNRRGGLYDFMRRILATDHGSRLYARRQASIEPVFGHQAQPRRRALPTPRPLSRQIRMAAAGQHPQHPQALAPQHRRGNRLTATATPHTLTEPSRRPTATGTTRPLRDSHHGKRQRVTGSYRACAVRLAHFRPDEELAGDARF
jgi:hypothetical protein